MMEINIINDFESLSRFENEWNNLALEHGNGWPTVSYAWVRSYLEHMLEPGESWTCVLAFENGKLVGVFPTIDCKKSEKNMSHSDFRLPLFSDLLIQQGKEKDVLPLLMGALDEIRRGWQLFAMNGMRDDSPIALLERLSGKSVYTMSEWDGRGSFNRIEGDYETYFESLSPKHRRNLRRLENKLNGLGVPHFRFLTGEEADPCYLDDFMQVEISGYKSAESKTGTAIINSPQRVKFKRALMQRLHDLGWLEWHILDLENKIIAMQMVFKMGSALTLYKISYDAEFSQLSPGKILAGKMFERAYGCGDVSEINWITDFSFNDLWNAEKRNYYGYRLYPKGILPYIKYVLPRKMWLSVKDTRFPGQALNKLHRIIKG